MLRSHRKVWLFLCASLAACSLVTDFDRSKIERGGRDGGGDGSAGDGDDGDAGGDGDGDGEPGMDGGGDGAVPEDSGTPPECTSNNDCGPDQLCCDEVCVDTSLTGLCESCDQTPGCNVNLASACVNRTCVCGASDQCSGTGDQSLCDPALSTPRCVECREDADCALNANGPQCVDGACAGCDPTENGCVNPTPICNTQSLTCDACSDSPNNCPSPMECSIGVGCVGCDPADNSGCSGETPRCNPATTACVACLVSAHCDDDARTPICTSNACVQCATNAECSTKTAGTVCVTSGPQDGSCRLCDPTDHEGCTGTPNPRCHPTDIRCVECLSNSDCSGAEPICNTTTNLCEPCATDAQCDAKVDGTVCITSGPQDGVCGTCNPGTTNGCTGGQVCSTSAACVQCIGFAQCGDQVCGGNNTCVDCTADGQCTGHPNGGQCVGGDCRRCDPLTAPGTDPGCSSATPQCTAGFECVQCLSDADCGGNTPICGANNTCVACTSFGNSGNTECAQKSTTTPACQANGSCGQCSASVNCTGGNVCDTGDGVCRECLVDSDCDADAEPLCHNNACVACNAAGIASPDARCAGDTTEPGDWCVTLAGSPFLGQCRGCDPQDNGGCPGTSGPAANDQCKPTDTTCVECVSSANCPAATPVCNTTTNTCECANAATCATGQGCVAGDCATCTTDATCAGAGGWTTPQCVDVSASGTPDFECRQCDPGDVADLADDVGCPAAQTCSPTTFLCVP